MSITAAFSREISLADFIELHLGRTSNTLDAALYRFNSRRLAAVLAASATRGVRLRLLLDRNKHEGDPGTQQLLADYQLPFRLLQGPGGPASKMQHKFVILDQRLVITGSYNWTSESEEENYENLLILNDAAQIERFRDEFEALWTEAKKSD